MKENEKIQQLLAELAKMHSREKQIRAEIRTIYQQQGIKL